MRRRPNLAAVPVDDVPRRDELEGRGALPAAVGATPGSGVGLGVFQADIDGARVRICARDEVLIQCGKASITLRRNGRVIIRGTYVETRSTGTNRIKGGQVRVN